MPVPPALQALAFEQSCVVSREQCLSLGVGRSTIATLLRRHQWQRVHAGVYATHAGPLEDVALVWAALLAVGPGAMASHQTALWLTSRRSRMSRPVHISVPVKRTVVPPNGVVVHRLALPSSVGHPPRMPAERAILEIVHKAASEAHVIDVVTTALGA